MIDRPKKGTYLPYFDHYLDQLLPDADVLVQLENGRTELVAALQGLSESAWNSSYAAGKWSVKELLGHLIDTERIVAYRALRLGRGDTTPLPSFEHNEYVSNHDWQRRTGAQLLAEYVAVRQSSLHLFSHLNTEELDRMGTVSEHPCTARALLFMLAGHEVHHLNILRERYL